MHANLTAAEARVVYEQLTGQAPHLAELDTQFSVLRKLREAMGSEQRFNFGSVAK